MRSLFGGRVLVTGEEHTKVVSVGDDGGLLAAWAGLPHHTLWLTAGNCHHHTEQLREPVVEQTTAGGEDVPPAPG